LEPTAKSPKRVVAGAIERIIEGEMHYLFGRRPPDAKLPGKWEIPGGQVEKGESQAAALQRELREELGLSMGELVYPWKDDFLFEEVVELDQLPDLGVA